MNETRYLFCNCEMKVSVIDDLHVMRFVREELK
jgi:hypothetical protein